MFLIHNEGESVVAGIFIRTLKLVSAIFSPNNSPPKTMKNVFHFI